MTRTLAEERAYVRPEDIRPAAQIKSALPTRAEVTAAVWGTKVSAVGGVIAGAVVAYLRDLAELHARRDCTEARGFNRSHSAILDSLDDLLVTGLPGITDWTRSSLVAMFDTFAVRAVAAHRACRELGADDPRTHALTVELADHGDAYAYFVAGLAGTPPWYVLDLGGSDKHL